MQSRKRKATIQRIVFYLAALCLLTIAVTIGVNGAMLYGMRASIVSVDALPDDADCVLVLGAGVRSDGTPSPMLADRIATGVSVYENGGAPKLLMSGDHGTDGYDEVYAMKKYALESGMNTDAVFCDHAGFSTYDSLYRAKEIFGCKKLIVVTQRFHLARAVYIGRRLGMEVYGVECDNGYVYGTAKTNALRESLARVKAVLDCELLKPQSKYLGEAIPISGKGSETDDKSFENKKDKT